MFEWEPAKFSNELNPGVGPALGTMLDPEVYVTSKKGKKELRSKVQFADDETPENLLRKELAVSDCGILESFCKDGKKYKLIRLLDRGSASG